MKSISIRFPLDQLKIHVEQARARGLDLSTYLRAKLATDAEAPINFHATRKGRKE